MKYVKYIFILAIFLIPNVSEAADRYWVGGTDTWNSTAGSKWSTTSGGAGGASAPTSGDNVFFDSNSGTGTVTIASTAAGANVDFTGFTGTLSHPAATTWTVSGSLTMSSGMTYTLGNAVTSAITFNSTASGNTFTSAGKTFGNITFDGSGGAWTLQDNLSTGSGATLTLTRGTLDTNGKTVNIGFFSSSNSNTRTLTLGASTVNINGNSGTEFSCITGSASFTLNANTSKIVFTNTNGSLNCPRTFNDVEFTGGGTMLIAGASGDHTFNNITVTGTADKLNTAAIKTGGTGTVTVTGSLNLNGNSSINRLLVESTTFGTQGTFTRTGATMNWSNVDFVDIALDVSYDCSGITGGCGDAGGNSNITFTSSQTNYWVGNGGNWDDVNKWASSSGGTAGTGRVPLPQDDVVFDNNSFSTTGQTVTTNGMPRLGRSIDWSAYNEGQSPNWTASNTSLGLSVYGSINLVNGGTSVIGTLNIGGTFRFRGRSSYNLTTGGEAFNSSTVIAAPGGSLTLQDALTLSSGSFSITHGTFSANNFNVTAPSVSISASTVRTLNMGSGTWTITSTGTIWDASTVTNLTFNANTSTIIVSNTTATAKTFAGGGLTYNNLTITGQNVTITGSNTFDGTLALEHAGLAIGTKFTQSTTQSVANFSANGSAGNLVYASSTSASVAYIHKYTPGRVCIDYVNFQSLSLSFNNVWYLGSNSVDSGGNEQAYFTSCPTDQVYNLEPRYSTSTNEKIRGGTKIRGGIKFR